MKVWITEKNMTIQCGKSHAIKLILFKTLETGSITCIQCSASHRVQKEIVLITPLSVLIWMGQTLSTQFNRF